MPLCRAVEPAGAPIRLDPRLDVPGIGGHQPNAFDAASPKQVAESKRGGRGRHAGSLGHRRCERHVIVEAKPGTRSPVPKDRGDSRIGEQVGGREHRLLRELAQCDG